MIAGPAWRARGKVPYLAAHLGVLISWIDLDRIIKAGHAE